MILQFQKWLVGDKFRDLQDNSFIDFVPISFLLKPSITIRQINLAIDMVELHNLGSNIEKCAMFF